MGGCAPTVFVQYEIVIVSVCLGQQWGWRGEDACYLIKCPAVSAGLLQHPNRHILAGLGRC